MSEPKQGAFEGWAIMDLMGHNRKIGYVTTEAFGPAVLFRCDTPELPERDYELTQPEYVGHSWTPAGAKVRRPASPPRTCLINPQSLYEMNPCTEAAARALIEKQQSRPLILLEMPTGLALGAAANNPGDEGFEPGEPDDDDESDPYQDGPR